MLEGLPVGPDVGRKVGDTVGALLERRLGSTVRSSLAIIVGEPLGLGDGIALL